MLISFLGALELLTYNIYFNLCLFNIDKKSSYINIKGFNHLHYENTPMQYTVIFSAEKFDNFLLKNCDILLYLLKT